MDNKVILIEGLPGTGKTTLSKRIYDLLLKKGKLVELLLEENEKIPSNFYNFAGIPKNELSSFLYPIPLIAETDNYVFINFGDCTEEIANKLQRYDVGNEFNKFITAQEYARCTLEWWQYWVKHNIKDSILILDSAFMQCPINEMLFRKVSDSEVKTYIQAIAEIIKPFNPVCIYLRREIAKIAIDFAKEVKGEQWAKGLDGLADIGCPDLFERRFDLEYSLLPFVSNIVCNIDGYNWSDIDTKIKNLF